MQQSSLSSLTRNGKWVQMVTGSGENSQNTPGNGKEEAGANVPWGRCGVKGKRSRQGQQQQEQETTQQLNEIQ